MGLLHVYVSSDRVDNYDCDYFYANLHDGGTGAYPGTVYYVHTSGPGGGGFTLDTGVYTRFDYKESELGGMIYDGDCGPGGTWWSGYHVHEKSNNETLINSRYSGGTYGVYCSPDYYHNSDSCLKISNGWSSYFTRRFEW